MGTGAALVQCVYTSKASEYFDEADLADILEHSRRNNGGRGVTGILLYEAGSFFQVLEGPGPAVRALYAKIRTDRRHERVVKLVDQRIDERTFGPWTMGAAELSCADLESVPGLNDFFDAGHCLTELDASRAKDLLLAFKNGRWHQAVA